MHWLIDEGWKNQLHDVFDKTYFQDLQNKLSHEMATEKVFPPFEDIFNAFNYSSYEGTKVVLIGQDPYHDEGQAHGLCFSVRKGVKIPPSLRNMYKELESDLGISPPPHGDLTGWAKQGILMLNATLTVRAHEAASHAKYGWQSFTDDVIRLLNDREDPIIFVLWGNFAKSKKKLITNERHIVIESAHPSPLSARRGFMGSKPYSKINDALCSLGKEPICWDIQE
jgi:uracil-DNA glycosylase